MTEIIILSSTENNKIEKKKVNDNEIQERLLSNQKRFIKEKITKRTVNKWIRK